jgi:uncharacterized protein (DUF2384 family)
MTVPTLPTLEIPEREKLRWVMEALGLDLPEVEMALDVDRSTLRRWLADETDKAALRDARFRRLLGLTQLAKGSIRPQKLREWMRRPNPRLGGLTPARIIGDEVGLGKVEQALRDSHYGNPL